MASLYKKRDVWYLALSINNNRVTRSLRTKDYKVAKSIKPHAESSIIAELNGFITRNENLSFNHLCERFLTYNHNWAENTYKLIKYILTSYLNGKPLPINPTSRAIHTRHINQCWNWGLKHNLITKAHKLPGDTKGESRHRTFTKDELDKLFNNIKDPDYNAFVRFAYYTGARSGEIRCIPTKHIHDGYLVAYGKTGRRIIKLNEQAKQILNKQSELWNYTKDHVTHKFKKEVRKLRIKDARFHDLRRTFGLNLIKQGMSIYKVSKLLGHASVRTTEKHYAPLLTIDIEDFKL